VIHLNKTKGEKERKKEWKPAFVLRHSSLRKEQQESFFFPRNDIFFIFVPSQINPHILAKKSGRRFCLPFFLA
jgi:hypothetical protein